jgi:class 3 adenylate cyclase
MPDDQQKEEKAGPKESQLFARITGLATETDPNYRAGASPLTMQSITATGLPINLPSSGLSPRTAWLSDNQAIDDAFSQQNYYAVAQEANTLRGQVIEKTKELSQVAAKSKQTEQLLADRDTLIKKYETLKDLSYLLNRVNDAAQAKLRESPEFQEQFSSGKVHPTFVMSVDIRQSTSLMLKARTPQEFATFINELCISLMRIITDHYGVVDKFTGDGVLAFFPEFYSGPDAGFFAVSAALKCHKVFRSHYKAGRTSFTSVLTDVGLGIGIDYGQTHFLKMADGLTVVGQPVVYACRLGAAPSGTTYLNQQAYEQIILQSRDSFSFSEANVEIKHEGSILAYAVVSSENQREPELPSWSRQHGKTTADNKQPDASG